MKTRKIVVWAVVDRRGKHGMQPDESRKIAKHDQDFCHRHFSEFGPYTVVRCEGTFTKPKGRKKK